MPTFGTGLVGLISYRQFTPLLEQTAIFVYFFALVGKGFWISFYLQV
jgi:hypothetical protein